MLANISSHVKAHKHSQNMSLHVIFSLFYRCGNVAAILELDEHLQKSFTIFEAAPQVCLSARGLLEIEFVCPRR